MQHNLIAIANTCTQMYSDPIQTTCSTINNQQSLVLQIIVSKRPAFDISNNDKSTSEIRFAAFL